MENSIHQPIVQIVIIRSDVPLRWSFVKNQSRNAEMIITNPLFIYGDDPDPDQMKELHLNDMQAYNDYIEYCRDFITTPATYIDIVGSRGIPEMLHLARLLESRNIGYFIAKEKKRIKIDQLLDIYPHGDHDIYAPKQYPITRTCTSRNCYVDDGTIYLKPSDEDGIIIAIAIAPVPADILPDEIILLQPPVHAADNLLKPIEPDTIISIN